MKGKKEPTVAILTENFSGQLLHFLWTWLGVLGETDDELEKADLNLEVWGLRWNHLVFGAIIKKTC